MEGVNGSISTCRHCYFYHLEGRRGGHCQQLGVSVQGGWQACSLGVSPFAKWKELIGLPTWAPDATNLSETAPESSHACSDALEALVEAELSPARVLASSYPMEAAVLESVLESAFESVRDTL